MSLVFLLIAKGAQVSWVQPGIKKEKTRIEPNPPARLIAFGLDSIRVGFIVSGVVSDVRFLGEHLPPSPAANSFRKIS